MKLVLAIVQDEDSDILMESLRENNIGATKFSTKGGFLKRGNTTILVGIEEKRLSEVVDIIKNNCREREVISAIPPIMSETYVMLEPYEVKVGGATVFVLDVDKFYKI